MKSPVSLLLSSPTLLPTEGFAELVNVHGIDALCLCLVAAAAAKTTPSTLLPPRAAPSFPTPFSSFGLHALLKVATATGGAGLLP